MPRSNPYRRRQIRLPVEMNDALEVRARERGITVSALIRLTLSEALFLSGDVSVVHATSDVANTEKQA